jgi:hypothetical protein
MNSFICGSSVVMTLVVTDRVFSTILEKRPEPFTQPNIPGEGFSTVVTMDSVWRGLLLVLLLMLVKLTEDGNTCNSVFSTALFKQYLYRYRS